MATAEIGVLRTPSEMTWSGDSDAETDAIRAAPNDIEQTPSRRSRVSEKSNSRASADLRRTLSNAISRAVSRLSTRIRDEPPPPPDGGFKAWSQVVAGFLVLFTTWGYLNAFGVFQTYYTETLPVSASAVSWIGAVQIFLSLVIGLFTGRLLDAGFFLPIYVSGAFLQVLGIFLMSISTKYWQLMLTQGVLTGLGNGIFFTPTLAMITTYFSKRRGIAVGIATTGNSTGGMIYPLITRQLLPQIGFAWTARVLGFINLTFLVVGLVFLRPRLPPRKSGPLIDTSALREPVYVLCVLAIFAVMWANYYTFYYIASFGRETLGLPYSVATITVILINGVGIPFRLIVPLIADRIGPVNTLVPTFSLWAIVAFCWLAVKDVAGYYAFACLYGIASGSMQSLVPTALASLTPRLDLVGTRIGMAFALVSVASLTGPPLGGAIQGASGGEFTGSQVWAACMTLTAFGLITAARILKVGWKPKIIC